MVPLVCVKLGSKLGIYLQNSNHITILLHLSQKNKENLLT